MLAVRVLSRRLFSSPAAAGTLHPAVQTPMKCFQCEQTENYTEGPSGGCTTVGSVSFFLSFSFAPPIFFPAVVLHFFFFYQLTHSKFNESMHKRQNGPSDAIDKKGEVHGSMNASMN